MRWGGQGQDKNSSHVCLGVVVEGGGGWGVIVRRKWNLYPEKGEDNFKTVFQIQILADSGFSNYLDPGFINSEPDLGKKDPNPKHYLKQHGYRYLSVPPIV